jgi:urea carboxylase-associated protein 2
MANAPGRMTHSVLAAQADARAQAEHQSEFMPYRPAASSPFIPDGVDTASVTWAETVAPGGYTHRVVARGTRIRFDDPTGDACATVVLFNALNTGERLNVADTVKIPWQVYLGADHPLLSGDGRVLATIVEDTSGHHDALCGTSSDLFNEQKFGTGAPQGFAPSGQSLLGLAAAKNGLSLRDIPPAISFFQGIRAEADGALTFTGSAGPGHHVDLVAELPLVILVATASHPLDPSPDYAVGPLRVHAWTGAATGPADGRFHASPERTRAYLNSIDYMEARA